MISGTDIASLITEHLDAHPQKSKQEHDCHDQTHSLHHAFAKDVQSLSVATEEHRNPFLEETVDLMALDSKEIACSVFVKTVKEANPIGHRQYEEFKKECLCEGTTKLDDVIWCNKLPFFVQSVRATVKDKQQLTSLKGDLGLFLHMPVTCQTCNGRLDEFFCHENPP